MSLLKNAIDSVILATEDFRNSEPRRILSCTRNLHAAMLLLFKEKLRRMSPPGTDEVLVKSRIVPHLDAKGVLSWKGQGKRTATVREIRERFEKLSVDVNWKQVERIQNYRNDIEHYFSNLSHKSARAYISDCFVVIRDFMRKHLNEDPLTLFGEETWSTFVEINDVYQKEKQECVERIQSIDWENNTLSEAMEEVQCTQCGSGLIDISNPGAVREEVLFTCRACGEKAVFEVIAEKAIEDYLYYESYKNCADGGEPEYVKCPDCGRNTYLLDDNKCCICDVSYERTCERCCGEIPAEELDGSGLCGWCSQVMDKDG